MAKTKPIKITDIFFGPAQRVKYAKVNREFLAKEKALFSLELDNQETVHTKLKKAYHEAMLTLFTKAPIKVEEVEAEEKSKKRAKKKSATKDKDVSGLI